jgi:hypothetical protein
MPQAPSKATIGSLDPFILPLPSAVELPKSLEGSNSYNFAEIR